MIQHTVNGVRRVVSFNCPRGVFDFVAAQVAMAEVMRAVITNHFDILCRNPWRNKKFRCHEVLRALGSSDTVEVKRDYH